jgi:hypothetical protein
MEEVTDEPLYRDRVCGIEIGKAGMVATIRVPSDKDPARRMAEARSFGTTKKEVLVAVALGSGLTRPVLALADWLRCLQVPAVGAGGDYWNGPMVRSPVCSSYRAI